jgi:excisionase family DNA binding protein
VTQRVDTMQANSGENPFAAAPIELLAASPVAMARLLELLEARITVPADPVIPAYAVASLAAVLRVSPRVVRGAITRGELAAVKRGGRWIISAEAVQAWAQLNEAGRPPHSRRRRSEGARPLGSAIALLGGASSPRRPL